MQCTLYQPQLAKQNGAVLVVSMIIMLVMTVLGLSAAGSASMEQKMATNMQNINITLQAAESAVEATANDLDVLGSALSATNVSQNIKLNSNYDISSQPVTSQAQIAYIGEASVDGFSLGVNKNNFVAHNFEVNGTGAMPGNVSTTTSQGVYRIAPSGN